MGFIKFLFKIVWWLFVIAVVVVVGFFGFVYIADNFESYPIWLQWTLMVPVIVFTFSIILVKPLIVLYAIYKAKEAIEGKD